MVTPESLNQCMKQWIASLVPQLAAQLCYSLIENHTFLDGNKRIGIHLTLVFLRINGIDLNYSQEDLIDFGLNIALRKMLGRD